MRLSVCMIVRDEEHNLPRALESCADLAEEIVVVDTGSQDLTAAIAKAHPRVRLFREPFENFSQAKGYALRQCRGDWVLVLDADERISPPLAGRLSQLPRSANEEREPFVGVGGFRIRRRNWILGRQMRSMGLERDYPLRLFRREGARYNRRPVHEAVKLGAGWRIGRLEEPLEHETFSGMDHYLRKIDRYTSLALEEHPRRHSTFHLVVAWPSTFLRYYVGRRGFRDGFPGFLWAAMTATGALIRDMKVWIGELPPPKP
jgi:glycosyltransferase involved in cell wall biosynthesis